MKKYITILAGIIFIASLFTSCSFTGTYLPTKKTIPDGTYVCESPIQLTGYYKKYLDGIETTESLDIVVRKEILIINGNTLHYISGENTCYEEVESDSYVTLKEPVFEIKRDLTGTYTICIDKKITFNIEGDTYVFQNGAYFDYEQNNDEIKFVKRAILDGAYVLGPFKKQ